MPALSINDVTVTEDNVGAVMAVLTVSLSAASGQTVTVANTGERAGQESILLFTRQHYASVTPSMRRLRAFQKVSLVPGQSRTVTFSVPAGDLAFVGRDGKRVLEPGTFDAVAAAIGEASPRDNVVFEAGLFGGAPRVLPLR